METASGDLLLSRTQLERVCRRPDRWTDRQGLDRALWLLPALSHGDHWVGLRILEGTVPDSAGLLDTCKQGRRFLFIFSSLKQRDKQHTQFLINAVFVGPWICDGLENHPRPLGSVTQMVSFLSYLPASHLLPSKDILAQFIFSGFFSPLK